MPEAVRNLGQQFVSQLGLDPGVDTFGRWMCHYIAEQMVKVEHAKGKEKEDAEEKCFDTILRFWQHRWQLPSGLRPFGNFEPILLLLERLDPDHRRNFYDHQIPHNEDDVLSLNDKQLKWIKFAQQVDKAARVLIEIAIEKCTDEAKDSETDNWLKNGAAIESSVDTKIIGKLTDFDISSLLEEYEVDNIDARKSADKVYEKYDAEKIKSRIQHLEQFSKMKRLVLKELKSKLKEMG